MKWVIRALEVGVLTSLVACGSTRLRHASADEFVSHAQVIGQMNSAYWAEFVGASQERAYLEYSRAITFWNFVTFSDRPEITVYWTEIDGLPEGVVTELRTRDNPRAGWHYALKDNQPMQTDGAPPDR
jgi:hypothetical protein